MLRGLKGPSPEPLEMPYPSTGRRTSEAPFHPASVTLAQPPLSQTATSQLRPIPACPGQATISMRGLNKEGSGSAAERAFLGAESLDPVSLLRMAGDGG